MGKADDIMENEIFEDGDLVQNLDDIDDGFLEPGKAMMTLNDLAEMLRQQQGENVMEDFIRFTMREVSELKYKEEIRSFLQGRSDIISESILKEIK